MLKFKFIIPLLLISLASKAQLNHRFIDPLSQWNIVSTNWDGMNLAIYYNNLRFDSILFEDDSLIVSKFQLSDNKYIEDKINHRVMWIVNSDTSLLYDFSMQIGDSIITKVHSTEFGFPDNFCSGFFGEYALAKFKITDTTTTEVGGEQRFSMEVQITCLDLDSNQMGTQTIYWVDGLGGRVGPNYFNVGMFFETGVEMTCYSYNDILSFGGPCDPYGIEEENTSVIRIYPIPVQQHLNIELEETFSDLVIYNTFGSIVYQTSSKSKLLDLSFLSSGVYLLELKTVSGVLRKSILKQ